MQPPPFCRSNWLRSCSINLLSIALAMNCFGFAEAQFRSPTPTPSTNDPQLVRPSGTSLTPPNAISPVQKASWVPETREAVPAQTKTRAPLELRKSSKESSNTLEKPKSAWGATLSMFFSLAVVISFFLLVVWLIKKSQPHSFVKLPGDVVQIMGRTPMAPRQQMYVVRFGSKLLLISHQPGQTQTLGEITDSDEVHRLAGLCEANQPGSITNSFRDVLKQVALGKTEPEPKASGRLARR